MENAPNTYRIFLMIREFTVVINENLWPGRQPSACDYQGCVGGQVVAFRYDLSGGALLFFATE